MLIPATILAFGFGPQEIILVVLVLIFFFGAKKIPEIARGLGKSMSEFKKGQAEGGDSLTRPDDATAPPVTRRDGDGNPIG